ncbi:hypothetical protein ACJMK2_006088 [Sinanodonta woodiana]|uniref:G-protein coupled receptors family 1 profile domain-containing protein n=1 Tax=Sinanodonta woodiana TaxID=1069815 RepID=A0ABD3VSC1_SINWO
MDEMTTNNSVANATTQDPVTDMDIKLQNILAILAMCILMLLTILGNAFVIASIFNYKPLRMVQNFFIISLSGADLAVAIFVMPFHIANTILQERWIFGNVLCDLWLTSDVLLCTASILNICAIALDRYWAIHDPINYAQKRNVKRVLVIIVIVWALSALISVPPLFGWSGRGGSMSDSFTGRCALNGEKGYVAYSALGSFYIPFLIMSFVYLKIYLATKKRLRDRVQNAKSELAIVTNTSYASVATAPNCTEEDESGQPSQMVNGTDNLSSSRSPHFSYQDQRKLKDSETLKQLQYFFEEKQRISLSKERKATRTLAIIMVAFVLCWLPFFLLYVIIPFCDICVHPGPEIEMLFVWLGYINSSLNPIIYTVFNREFRKAFNDMIHMRCLGCKSR